jgi:hypothetical protein
MDAKQFVLQLIEEGRGAVKAIAPALFGLYMIRHGMDTNMVVTTLIAYYVPSPVTQKKDASK